MLSDLLEWLTIGTVYLYERTIPTSLSTLLHSVALSYIMLRFQHYFVWSYVLCLTLVVHWTLSKIIAVQLIVFFSLFYIDGKFVITSNAFYSYAEYDYMPCAIVGSYIVIIVLLYSPEGPSRDTEVVSSRYVYCQVFSTWFHSVWQSCSHRQLYCGNYVWSQLW